MKLPIKNLIASPTAGDCMALHHLDQYPAPIKLLVANKLQDLRARDARDFEHCIHRIMTASRKSERDQNIDAASTIIREQTTTRGRQAASPLQSQLDAARAMSARPLLVKERFDSLRRQGIYARQIIRTLACELQITQAAVQHYLLQSTRL